MFVCHGDTNFHHVICEKTEENVVRGHMDNFAGVYAVLQSYFSG